jgi:hypothetical protein
MRIVSGKRFGENQSQYILSLGTPLRKSCCLLDNMENMAHTAHG